VWKQAHLQTIYTSKEAPPMTAYRRLNPSAFLRRSHRSSLATKPRKPVDKRSLPETINITTDEHAPRYTVVRSEGREKKWMVVDGETNLTVYGASADEVVVRERCRVMNEREEARGKGARQ
jgi:hypothetical protein